MVVSLSRNWATVYVMMGLFGLWWDYIGSSKMILYTFVTLHIAICDFEFFKILENSWNFAETGNNPHVM